MYLIEAFEVLCYLTVVGLVKKVILFCADMNLSQHIDNKKKDVLVLGKGPTDGLDNTNLTAEKSFL